MGLMPPVADMTMETVDGHQQVKFASIPIGPRIPVPGKRCSKKEHKSAGRWRVEEYQTIGGINRDEVCTVCGDRRYLGRRPYPKGQEPNFNAQLAAAMRSHISHKP
jgi:hypothetical protein